MRPEPAASGPRSAAWIAGMALLYGLLSVLSLLLAARPGQMATLWFANAMGVVALLALPRRSWLMKGRQKSSPWAWMRRRGSPPLLSCRATAWRCSWGRSF